MIVADIEWFSEGSIKLEITNANRQADSQIDGRLMDR